VPFRPRNQLELERLGDDELVAYLREAAADGHPSADLALAMLAFGHEPAVRMRVRLKNVPPQDVEDVTAEILFKALTSAFDGTSGGRFGAWMNRITQRAIADYFRRGPGRARSEPLEDRDLEAPGEHAVELEDAVERTLAGLNGEHRRVVELTLLEGFAAREIDGVSQANVHQIVSRFRRSLRGQLDADPKGSP
jgi:RNA polymerase sigma factor (sigma-70 family)